MFSESRRINHASKGKTVTKTYGVTPKNHHVPVINIQQIINHSADPHLLMTFLSGQTQMRPLSLFLCKSTFLQNHLRHCDGQHLRNDLLVVGIPSTVRALSNLWSRGGGAFGWFSQQRLAWAATFHTSLAPSFSFPRLLSSHSPSLLPSDSVFSPSQPSLIQQLYIKHLPLQNTASCYHSVTL